MGLLAALAAPAFASFELVMVLDRGTKKIHRFDGTTGAYFGSFGNFSSSVKSISIDQANNRVFVFDGAGVISTWNYNTGEMIGAVGGWNGSIRWVGPSLEPDRYVLSFMDRFEQWTWPITPSMNIFPTIGTTQNVERFDGGYVAFGASGFRRMTAGFVSGASVTMGGTQGLGAIANSDFGRFAVAGRTGSNLGDCVALVGSGFGTNYTWSAPSINNITGVGSAHSGFYVSGKNAANTAQGRITKMIITPNVYEQYSFGENVLVDPVGVVTVVAPEPASLLVLGLGALVALRRRRG